MKKVDIENCNKYPSIFSKKCKKYTKLNPKLMINDYNNMINSCNSIGYKK